MLRPAVIALLGLAALAPRASAGTYENADYDYSVDLPDGFQQCQPGGADHGPGFYLDGPAADDGCATSLGRPAITVSPEYETLFDTNLTTARRRACHYEHGRLRPAPAGLHFANIPTQSCRIDFANGWTGVLVIAGRFAHKDGDVSTLYEAWLQTRPWRWKADLATFRRVVATVRVNPVR